jgi:hypothetical protein
VRGKGGNGKKGRRGNGEVRESEGEGGTGQRKRGRKDEGKGIVWEVPLQLNHGYATDTEVLLDQFVYTGPD